MRLLIIYFLLVSLPSCGQDFENLVFGNDSTLDVVTWDLESFPKNGIRTITYVANIIEAIDADVYALQEIEEEDVFDNLLVMLDDYDGFLVDDEDSDLAYIYKTSTIDVINIYEIYQAYNLEFPRAPLVIRFTFMEEEYGVINNRLKCCGDGWFQILDETDEETRRYYACEYLKTYMDAYFNNQNVITLGNLNDELVNENGSNSVFNPFYNYPDSYQFQDYSIADGDSLNWSFPETPEHVDHIIINDELFDEMANELSLVETIRLDDYFSDGLEEYISDVSDHRPVGIRIQPDDFIMNVENKNGGFDRIDLYPNPNSGVFNLTWNSAIPFGFVRIYNSQGQVVEEISLETQAAKIFFELSDLSNGIYSVVLSSSSVNYSSPFVISK